MVFKVVLMLMLAWPMSHERRRLVHIGNVCTDLRESALSLAVKTLKETTQNTAEYVRVAGILGLEVRSSRLPLSFLA
jgi:hypothetical protein